VEVVCYAPLAVPGVRLADGAAALHTDRGAVNHFTSSATGGVKCIIVEH